MALTLKRKPLFSCFGGPGSALVGPLFQLWIQGVFFNVFMWFSMILESFRLPFGSLWASLFRGISDLLYDGWQSCLRGTKRHTFRCFWVPFGRIWGDIWEGLGRNLNTPFLAMP